MKKNKGNLFVRTGISPIVFLVGIISVVVVLLFIFLPPPLTSKPAKRTAQVQGAPHGLAQERQKQSKGTGSDLNSIKLLPIDENMPANPVIKQGLGPPEELSLSSREKTVHAITNFISNVKRAGFKFDPGSVTKPVRVRTIVNSSSILQTEHAVFGVMWSASGDYGPIVDHITSIGKDQNGVDRSFSALTAGGTSLTRLQDPNLYPVKTSPDDVYPMVMDFLSRQIPDNNLVVNDVYRPQAPSNLPILIYQFVEPEDYKNADPIGTVNITLRIGGTDLQPGQAELLGYEDNGIGIRGHKRTFPKPPASLLPSK